MRWNSKNPYPNSVRLRIKFLFWPKDIDGEVRWLEKAGWNEEFVECNHGPNFWAPIRWVKL